MLEKAKELLILAGINPVEAAEAILYEEIEKMRGPKPEYKQLEQNPEFKKQVDDLVEALRNPQVK